MWPFSRKRKRAESVPVMSDILGDRNLQDLSQNRAVLRVWLPQEIKTALDEVNEQQNEVAAKFVREFFIIYLYGMHELLSTPTVGPAFNIKVTFVSFFWQL
jgi:hypothetical protein